MFLFTTIIKLNKKTALSCLKRRRLSAPYGLPDELTLAYINKQTTLIHKLVIYKANYKLNVY